MKKSICCIAVAATSFLSSCKPNEPVLDEVYHKSSRERALDTPFLYAENNLRKIGKGVIIAAEENSKFKNSIYEEIEKRFDGDYNVLIKTITEKSGTFDIDLNKKIIQANETISEGEGLKAFADIDGKSYNPQIFIPFYEELKNNNRIGIEKPVLVVFNGKRKEKDLEKAYLFDEGRFVDADFLIDEEYAKKHEVWVLSINDRTGGDRGSEALALDKAKDQEPKTGAARPAAGNRDFPYINGVGISLHKESWASGANDVYFECVYTDGANPDYVPMPDNLTKYVGDWGSDQMGEFRNVEFILKQIGSNSSGLYLFGGTNSYGPYGNRYHAFVLYEHDNWPAGINVAYIPINGYNVEIGYRSAESAYMEDYSEARRALVSLKTVWGSDRSNGASRVRTTVRTF